MRKITDKIHHTYEDIYLPTGLSKTSARLDITHTRVHPRDELGAIHGLLIRDVNTFLYGDILGRLMPIMSMARMSGDQVLIKHVGDLIDLIEEV